MSQNEHTYWKSQTLESARQELQEFGENFEKGKNWFEEFKKRNRYSPDLSSKEAYEQLKKEYETLEKEANDIKKITSASRDARKMYGDVTPGDLTHQDVVLAYQNHFKEGNRILTKQLGASGQDKFGVWQAIGIVAMESFERNKKHVIDEMTENFKKELVDSIKSPQQLDEKKSDFYRAFKLYLQSLDQKHLEQLKLEIADRIPGRKNDLFDLAMNIITQLDPEDYFKFIEEET